MAGMSSKGRAAPAADPVRGNYRAIELPTLVDYCRHYAESSNAGEPAFTHVTDQPGQHERLSFSELDRRARAIAAEIQRRGGAGHPVLVVQDPGVDYAASLFGCLYARAIAVPVYPPQMLRLQQTMPRLQAMIANAGAKCMLSTREIIGDRLHPMWQMPDSMAIAVNEVKTDSADDWDGILPQRDDVAVLQYTSGSTGNPRGVVLSHRVLLNNLSAVIEHYHFEGANSVQWVPPYHDMGLIGGIFVPIYRGVEAVVISPVDFVRNPLLWLQCIDHYNGTSNGSPNFGYELCVRRIQEADCNAVNLDLSSWKVAIAGAEPVRASTLRSFTEKFAPYGFAAEAFCPAFGMAETTVVATGKPLGELHRTLTVDSAKLQCGQLLPVPQGKTDSTAAMTQELVSSGVAVKGMAYEIVDPVTCRRVPDGTVGEIWFRGDSIAQGYWNDPESTARTFGAKLRDDSPDESFDERFEFLRTGDLGSRVDGELFVTGRLKELIIVGGRNLYPHDVEEVVQSVSEAFRGDTGTAFSVDTGESEELVIVQELWRPKKFKADELLPDIVSSIAENLQVTPHAVVLVQSGTLPKTSSGKLRRSDTKRWFLSGELNELARWQPSNGVTATDVPFEAPSTSTEIAVAEIWSRLLNTEDIGRSDDFFRLGGGSLLVAQMLTEVAEKLLLDVSMTTLFRHPQLAAFAAAVDSHSKDFQSLGSSGLPPSDSLQASSATTPNNATSFPLADPQRRFWLLEQLGQTNAFVVVPISIHLEGRIDSERFETAIDSLVAKHPMLRARLTELNGDVVQVIGTDRSPMFQVSVHDEPDGSSRIDLRFHHMICDATSIGILLGDLHGILCGSKFEDKSNEQLHYVDYALWDQSESHQRAFDRGQQYWQERLGGAPSELHLPERRDEFSETPHVWKALVKRELVQGIEQIAATHGMTASMVCLNVFETLLARYGDSDDFVVTIPTSNRPASGLSHTVGCFVNPVMYRANVDPDQTISDAMSRTRDRLLGDLDHASVPFHRVVESTKVTRSVNRMPLSQVMFLYQPPTKSLSRLGDVAVRSLETDYSAVTAYDLSLIVQPGVDSRSEMEITLVAGESMDRDVAKSFFDSFQTTLTQIASEPNGTRRVRDLQLQTNSEVNLPQSGSLDSVVERVRQHALDTPSQTAVCDDQGSITYAELNRQSDRIASALSRQDVEPGDLIGIDLPRSTRLLVAILGVWKSRCAYLPLDTSLPHERRQRIIESANPVCLMDASVFQSMLGENEATEYTPLPTLANDLAYVMYTSGSTGQPKGVAVEHQSVSNLLSSFAESPGFESDDSMLAVTTVTFDISVLEMTLPLWCGGAVRITQHRISDQPELVAKVIEEFEPTHIQSTPSAFRMLLSTNWKPKRETTLLCGGEPLLPDLAEELLSSNDRLWNVYGPTETTVWSTLQRVQASESITIGRPIANTLCRVVDRHGLDTPPGVAGELLIGGVGVARGYFNDDAQTSQMFFESQGNRFYRTGDQVRMRFDGELEFLARNDRQVKIRGFRVELDEIESALQLCKGVDRAAVILREGSRGSDRLVAFCAMTKMETSPSDQFAALREELARKLPEYMIPTSIELLAELPQTPAGKTDYKALPNTTETLPIQASEIPQTPIEQALADAWCEILERDEVGRNDHFFDIGGNSLMAAQLFARLRERFKVNLRLSEIFSRPTIAALADAIVHSQAETHADDIDDLLSQLDSISEDDALKALELDS